MNRRTFLRCLPATPLAAAALPTTGATAEAKSASVEIGDWIDGREVIELCESCSKPLFEGDLVCRYPDGPTFCEAHSPTWNDLKAEQDEAIADGGFEDLFEDPDEAKDAREAVLAHIAAGDGDKKHVWAL